MYIRESVQFDLHVHKMLPLSVHERERERERETVKKQYLKTSYIRTQWFDSLLRISVGTNNENFTKNAALTSQTDKNLIPDVDLFRISQKRYYEKYNRRDATVRFRLHHEYDFALLYYRVWQRVPYKLPGRSSKTGKFLRSCRDRWLLPARAPGLTGDGERGVLLKVAARKKRPFALQRTCIHSHAQPRYEASLRAISNGLHRASANVKFDVHDYCSPSGDTCAGPRRVWEGGGIGRCLTLIL